MADTEAFDAASEAPDFIKEHAEDIYAVFTMSEANCYMEKIVLMQQQLKNSRIVLRKMHGISYLTITNL